MLNPDRLTVKASGAIQGAAQESRRREHPQIEGVHLLHALLEQEEGIVVPILQKLGTDPSLILQRVQEALQSRARVTGGSDPTLSRDLTKALDIAEEEARGLWCSRRRRNRCMPGRRACRWELPQTGRCRCRRHGALHATH